MLCFSIAAMLILCSGWAANPGVTLEACAFRAPPSVNAYWLRFFGECSTVKLCWTSGVASKKRFLFPTEGGEEEEVSCR